MGTRKRNILTLINILAVVCFSTIHAEPVDTTRIAAYTMRPMADTTRVATDTAQVAADTYAPCNIAQATLRPNRKEKSVPVSSYELPYSFTQNTYDWHRLWMNTATLTSAFVGTLLVLECLPEDATSWNRAELQDVPLFKRWRNHVIKEGPEWDHDKFYFTIFCILMPEPPILWRHGRVDSISGNQHYTAASCLPWVGSMASRHSWNAPPFKTF